MKKAILITAFVLLAGLNSLVAQQINPIPSYNYPLTTLNTAFQEIFTHYNPGREKRDMDVTISASSTHPGYIFATVWVVKNNGIIIKGPYTLTPNHHLSVPIDHGRWGVVINCSWNVNASVWIDD